MAAGGRPTDPVREDELLPELFRVADSASLLGQRRSITLARWQLLLLTAAAAAGSTGGGPLCWLAAAAYLAAAGVALRLTRQQPHGLWYEGRAAAESVKTLAWKFAVRADAYQPPPATLPDAEGLYRLQLRGLLHGFRHSPALPADAEQRASVTAAMRALRDEPLAVRREVYLRERVRAQHDWYRAKGAYCDRAGRSPSCWASRCRCSGWRWPSPGRSACCRWTCWARCRRWRCRWPPGPSCASTGRWPPPTGWPPTSWSRCATS